MTWIHLMYMFNPTADVPKSPDWLEHAAHRWSKPTPTWTQTFRTAKLQIRHQDLNSLPVPKHVLCQRHWQSCAKACLTVHEQPKHPPITCTRYNADRQFLGRRKTRLSREHCDSSWPHREVRRIEWRREEQAVQRHGRVLTNRVPY